MNDNLEKIKNPYCIIKKDTEINNESFELIIERLSFKNPNNMLAIYVILYSYINSKHMVIKKTLLVSESGKNIYYKDISIIQKFSYIDFKIWALKFNNMNISGIETHLLACCDDELISFKFFAVTGSMENVKKKIGASIIELRPKMPLLRQEILTEIVGTFDELLIDKEN